MYKRRDKVKYKRMPSAGKVIRVAHPLYQTGGDGSTPLSPLQLNINPIPLKEAMGLNKLWHSRLPQITRPVGSHTICFGAEYGGKWYAIAIWSDPIARNLNGRGWLELRRMAISSDSPANTASRMISIMVKQIKQFFPDITKLISYQDTDVHHGTIYKASGWVKGPTSHSPGDSWGVRRRSAVQTKSPKIRWERQIR